MRTRDEADTVQLSKVRIKEALRADLEKAAAKNKRTMNAEVAQRLEDSFGRLDAPFGGREGLQLAVMLTASFRFAGGQCAAMRGHPEWSLSEWLLDKECFETALAALVDSVWAHHPQPVAHDDFYRWLERLWSRRRGEELTEKMDADAAAAERT